MTVDHDSPQAAVAPAYAGAGADVGDAASPPQASDTPEEESADLVRELSRAMHRTALAQHKRLVAEVAGLRSSQAETIKVRTAREAEQLKLESDADVEEIDLWAQTATEMIAEERVRRIDARREHLQAQLARQDLIAEREVMAVDVTLEDHEAALEAFFTQLETESDPATIARLAATLPSLPSLSEAAEAAKRHAISEFAALDDAAVDPGSGGGTTDDAVEVSPSRLMAVMDPDATRGSSDEAPTTWPEPRVVVVAAGESQAAAPTDTEGADQPAEPVAAGSYRLLRSIPAARPMERLMGRFGNPAAGPDSGDAPAP
jgi:hypothetical protein